MQEDFEEFSKGFGFQETNDQASVIAEVKSDLASEKPQDRLICGEVGFGKTEIALRAAFICAKMNNRLLYSLQRLFWQGSTMIYLKTDFCKPITRLNLFQEKKLKRKKQFSKNLKKEIFP